MSVFEIFQFAMAFALRLQVAAKDIHHSEQLAANFPFEFIIRSDRRNMAAATHVLRQ